MNVQRIVSAVVALVIVVGGDGCRQMVADRSEDVAERVAERAVDQAYEYEAPAVAVGGADIPADAGEEVAFPEG